MTEWDEMQIRDPRTTKYLLDATYQKSYYRKAYVYKTPSGDIYLQSYDKVICKIVNPYAKSTDRGEFVKLWNGYSRTTMCHINDFRIANSFDPLTRKEWDALPCDNPKRYELWLYSPFFRKKYGPTWDNYDDAEEYGEKLVEENNNRYNYEVVEVKKGERK